MKNRFEYIFVLGDMDIFPEGKRSPLPAFEQRGREYFKRLPEQKTTLAELHKKEKQLRQIKNRLLAIWWENGDDPALAKEYIRDAIDYVNSFNYYRFKKQAPDFLPVETLRVVLGIQSVADCPNYVGKHQEWVQDAAQAILEHLLNKGQHMMGVYLYGFEI